MLVEISWRHHRKLLATFPDMTDLICDVRFTTESGHFHTRRQTARFVPTDSASKVDARELACLLKRRADLKAVNDHAASSRP